MAVSYRSLAPRATQLALHTPSTPCSARHLPQISSKIRNPKLRQPVQAQLAAPFHRRFASTSQEFAGGARSLVVRTQYSLLGTTIGLLLIFGYYYFTDTRAGVHQWVAVPLLRWIYDDAEEAHEAGVKALKGLYSFGLHPRERGNPDGAGDLQVEIFGHAIANPIGTSAGIDKHAEIPSPLLGLGPAVIEIGGTTKYPQDGNPKPRVFRISSQKAFINRYGLNSEGCDDVAMRLRQRVREYAYANGFGIDEDAERTILDGEAGVPPGSLTEGKLMAVQVAKNKATPDDDIEAVKADYVYCVEALAKYADIITVNVSSPNTPGLRGLQKVEPLTNILTGVVEAAKRVDRKSKPAVMVKVSPDEDSEEQVSGICNAVWESGVDGVIVGNTTTQRPDPSPIGYDLPPKEVAAMLEQGGYSGPQLFGRTLALVKKYRQKLDEGAGHKPFQPPTTLESSKPQLPSTTPPDHPVPHDSGTDISTKIDATATRDSANLKPETPEAEKASKSQPLIRLPARHNPFSPETVDSNASPALSSSTHIDQLPPAHVESTSPSAIPSPSQASPSPSQTISALSQLPQKRKVIFATGGITNGKQALDILDAGASVAMVYTALVYGGVGTVTRIKEEMREELEKTGPRMT